MTQLHYVEFFHDVPGTTNDIVDRHTTLQTGEKKTRARVKNAKSSEQSQSDDCGHHTNPLQHRLLPV